MIELHPQILEKDGQKEFVVLPYGEYEKLREELMDYEDLKELRIAKEQEKNVQGYSIDETRKKLGLDAK